jgi:hypothetical protein
MNARFRGIPQLCPQNKELEQFCSEHGFLYHTHGSGKWGSERYWSYYKVENNDRTVFSIEYFPVSGTARISIANNRYQGEVESVAHLQELMAAMRINLRQVVLVDEMQ